MDKGVIDEKALEQVPDGHLFRFRLHESEVFVCGTAHVSDESASFVERVVDAVQPNVLMVELCPQRISLLLPPEPVDPNKKPLGALEQAKQVLSSRQGLSGVFQLALGYFYSRLGNEIKITPGAEFRAAVDAAQRGRIPFRLVLGDREIGVTIQRAWGLLPLMEKIKLMFQLVKSMFAKISKEDIERMKQTDVLTNLMIEFCEYFPSLSRVLLTERDLYLARCIWHLSLPQRITAEQQRQQLQQQQQQQDGVVVEDVELEDKIVPAGERIVAVVGLGHAKGMTDAIERWRQGKSKPEDDCKDLMVVPPTPWSARRIMLLLLVIVVLTGVLGFFGVRQAIRAIF